MGKGQYVEPSLVGSTCRSRTRGRGRHARHTACGRDARTGTVLARVYCTHGAAKPLPNHCHPTHRHGTGTHGALARAPDKSLPPHRHHTPHTARDRGRARARARALWCEMEQQQQLRRKLQERKRKLESQRPTSPPKPRPASPPGQQRQASPSQPLRTDDVSAQRGVAFAPSTSVSEGSPNSGGDAGHANGRGKARPGSPLSAEMGNGATMAAAGRSIGPVSKAAGSAVALMTSAAGSAAATAVDTASSAALAAVAIAGSAASAAASATGCLPQLQGEELDTPRTPAELLREVPLFSGISRSQIERVAQTMQTLEAPAGKEVVRQGDTAEEMYVVESGRLVVTVTSPIGVEVGVVKEYTTGSFFGELAILSHVPGPRSATVTAVEPSRLFSLRREAVAELLKHQGLFYTLGQVSLFAGLDVLKLHQIGNSMKRRKVAADEIVIRQGDTGNEMFVVESGRLEASVVTEDGKDIGVVKVYGAGEYFGELAIMGNGDVQRSATVTATDEGTLLLLERDVVSSLLQSGMHARHFIPT